ncbi:hypothetical protein [Parafrankia sp. EUN1f]|uniref:hypothetical protein n=1 Tax=Parafrankia sp. EUN1f TaxID=102897 RepID=UPI0001C45B1C|nr:hypothetical protein [Parafrankia sp. EUN1f]EFC81824.1 hypothetical protein FrEUN1fDRAFT_5071 [Parafrankia sp. EUN1f]
MFDGAELVILRIGYADDPDAYPVPGGLSKVWTLTGLPNRMSSRVEVNPSRSATRMDGVLPGSIIAVK